MYNGGITDTPIHINTRTVNGNETADYFAVVTRMSSCQRVPPSTVLELSHVRVCVCACEGQERGTSVEQRGT